jgi:hypothetical protein
MGYTFTEHTANGTQVTYPFRFAGRDKGYLRASDVRVDTLQGDTWTKVTSGWQLTGTNQITFDVAPAAGLKIRIRREVPKENPYAEFDRGVTLDMKSLNGSFIHNLEATQELLDGFYPEGYYIKQNVSWGGNKITDLADGTAPNDAVNRGQLDSVDNNLQTQIDANDAKQTAWNQRQDEQIVGIIKSFDSNISHRTAPWTYEAAGGETKVSPPFFFHSALVWRDGVFQDELAGAFEIVNNEIRLAQPALRKGERVSVLIGSRIAVPEVGNVLRMSYQITEGTTVVNLGTTVGNVEVYLDGLLQDEDAYTLSVDYRTLTFTEPLPECRMLVKAVFDNRTHLE